jgi:hypothetical protein
MPTTNLGLAYLISGQGSPETTLNSDLDLLDTFTLKKTGDTATGPLIVSTTTGSNLTLLVSDAGTTNEPTVASWQHRTSGTPGAGFGVLWTIQADNSTNALTTQFSLASGWSSATAGAESSLVSWFVKRSGADVEIMRFNPNGNGQLRAVLDFQHAGAGLGFYGVTPITQRSAYTLTGTATRTFPTDPSSAYTGLATGLGSSPYAAVADVNTLRGVVSTLLGVVRQIVADLGKTAGVGLNAT